MQQFDIFQELPLPKSNTQEVLFVLIQQGEVSILDFPYLSGFRTRVSELQNAHNLKLSKKMVLKKNKFGNAFLYAKHILNENNKRKAVDLYKKLINN